MFSSSSSSSSSSLQPSSSQLPSLLLPLPLSLPSELYAQPDITLLVLPVELGAATPPCVSTASLAIAFQVC